VFICDECVELCNDIIREEMEETAPATASKLPKPRDINQVLDEYVIGQERAKKVLVGRRLQPLQAPGAAACNPRQNATKSKWPRAISC
jgi:hypothetical protein